MTHISGEVRVPSPIQHSPPTLAGARAINRAEATAARAPTAS
jgi:hypothetical protein